MNKTLKDIWMAGHEGRCHKWEHYFHIYERYLQKYRDQKISYLEIGVQRGGSLDMMREYLGNEATIIGIDKDPYCKRSETNGHKIFIGDQSDKSLLFDVIKEHPCFDIIIDDGGHTSDQQIKSFTTLFPYLNYGGVYIVEDLHCSQYWVGYQNSDLGINFLDYAKGLADKLSLYHMREDWFLNRYGTDPKNRPDNHIKFSNLAVNDIFSICFFDSIIAIEKEKRTEPYHIEK